MLQRQLCWSASSHEMHQESGRGVVTGFRTWRVVALPATRCMRAVWCQPQPQHAFATTRWTQPHNQRPFLAKTNDIPCWKLDSVVQGQRSVGFRQHLATGSTEELLLDEALRVGSVAILLP